MTELRSLPDPLTPRPVPFKERLLRRCVMRNTFQRRALLVLGGPLFSKGWKEMVGGGSEFLRR